jgi:hypothetical protein
MAAADVTGREYNCRSGVRMLPMARFEVNFEGRGRRPRRLSTRDSRPRERGDATRRKALAFSQVGSGASALLLLGVLAGGTREDNHDS